MGTQRRRLVSYTSAIVTTSSGKPEGVLNRQERSNRANFGICDDAVRGGVSPVYEAIQSAATEVGLVCRRADEIWETPAIIQDIVNLIDKSFVVVCDCTGRNANVFYEIGIAHTLGREVVLITQVDADVPFDLRHLRYVKYLDNDEGRRALKAALTERFGYLQENL